MTALLAAGVALQTLVIAALAAIIAPLLIPSRTLREFPRLLTRKVKARARRLRSWLRGPRHMLTALIIAGAAAAAALTVGILGQLQDDGTRMREWSVELISVSFAVLVIDYANRRRVALEFKQSIIRQLASRSNDFALDAASVVLDERWHHDGSLRDIYLAGASLQGLVLPGARLEGALLVNSHLEGANLQGASLERALLMHAHLERANLTAAYFKGASLRGAHLQGAWLMFAFLIGANLEDAHLEGAVLLYAYLDGARLARATYDARTRWPNGFDPGALGAIFVAHGQRSEYYHAP